MRCFDAMARRYADLDRGMLLRACKLAELPGITRAVAAERFGISVGMLRRALKEFGLECRPDRPALVLHCLSDGGRRTEGELGDLAIVASYLDYVNKDGSTAADIRSLLDQLVGEGWLTLDGRRWTLRRDFP